METKTKQISGISFIILLLGSMSGFSFYDALTSDVTLYKCIDEEKVRNCPNGVKAEGKRCYYNESNSYAYDYCSSNWTEVNKEKLLEELYSSKIKTSVDTGSKPSNALKYLCKPKNEGNCTII